MASNITIQCKSLGVVDERVLAGASLEVLIDDAERKLEEDGIAPSTPGFRQVLEDTIRSAILQASRPARVRSNNLPKLIDQLSLQNEKEAAQKIIAGEVETAADGADGQGVESHQAHDYDKPSGKVSRRFGYRFSPGKKWLVR